jgi:SAM-dependent methyltransferase
LIRGRPRCYIALVRPLGPTFSSLWLFLRHPRRYVLHRRLRRQSAEQVFRDIYHKHGWSSRQSVSGPGSDLAQTETLRTALPSLIAELGCRSMLDIPCGDFLWMSQTPIELDYTGADIVEELVAQNRQVHARAGRRFVKLNLLADPLPKVDLVLCRDCLVHFSFADVFRALANIRSSGATYLLTTTFNSQRGNVDIPTGAWRPINLELPPFNLPRPTRLINEQCTQDDGRFADKCLGLWPVAELGRLSSSSGPA